MTIVNQNLIFFKIGLLNHATRCFPLDADVGFFTITLENALWSFAAYLWKPTSVFLFLQDFEWFICFEEDLKKKKTHFLLLITFREKNCQNHRTLGWSSPWTMWVPRLRSRQKCFVAIEWISTAIAEVFWSGGWDHISCLAVSYTASCLWWSRLKWILFRLGSMNSGSWMGPPCANGVWFEVFHSTGRLEVIAAMAFHPWQTSNLGSLPEPTWSDAQWVDTIDRQCAEPKLRIAQNKFQKDLAVIKLIICHWASQSIVPCSFLLCLFPNA